MLKLSQLVPLFGSNPDVTVTGGTYNPSTGEITFYNNTGGTFNVSGFITGFTDSYVSGGTYSLGTATFTNTTGGTFNVSGFFTGGTDVYLTGGTYTSGNATFTNTTGGTFVVTGFTEPFSGGSGNCITDLYITNLHGCSPLNINPLDEGNVYFGSTSAVTIDLTNNRVGIGTTTPTEKLDVSGKTKTINFQMTSGATPGYVLTSDASGNASWQASSGGVSIDPYYTEPSAISITWDVSGNSTNYQTVLTANTTLNLSNVRNGDYGTIIVQQDGVGSRTITFGTVNGAGSTHRVVNGGAGIPVLTSNPNAIDILTFTYNGSVMYWTVGNDYT